MWLVAAADAGLAISDFIVRPIVTSADPRAALRGGLVLAALAAIWHRRRRPGHRVGTDTRPPAAGSPFDRCLRSLAAVPAGRATLLAIHLGPRVAEVFWDGPPPDRCPPWNASREGWVWDAPVDDLDGGDAPPDWLGAVVELGDTDTGTLWLHLSAFRRIGTSGDGHGRVVGAFLLDGLRAREQPELAVVVLGDPLRAATRDADPAAVEDLLGARWRRAARRHPPRPRDDAGPARRVVVFGAATDDSTQRVVDAARGDPDSTVIVIGSASNDELVLHAADGRLRVPFLGDVTVSSPALRSPGGARQPQLRRPEPDAIPAPAGGPADGGVEIRVLGPVEAVGAARPLAGKGLELVTYLACHPDGVADERIRAALWPDRPPTPDTWANRVSTTRKALGEEPDGTPRLRRFRKHVGRVAPSVRTDLAALTTALAAFRAEPTDAAADALAGALGAVRGRPFDMRAGYRWAHDELHVAQAERAVVDAAHHLAERALDAGDLARAGWCRRQGLLACPDDEGLRRDRHHAGIVDAAPRRSS